LDNKKFLTLIEHQCLEDEEHETGLPVPYEVETHHNNFGASFPNKLEN